MSILIGCTIFFTCEENRKRFDWLTFSYPRCNTPFMYKYVYLLYEYRVLRVVFGRNTICISLHTIIFTCEICRMSVLIGRTILFTC